LLHCFDVKKRSQQDCKSKRNGYNAEKVGYAALWRPLANKSK